MDFRYLNNMYVFRQVQHIPVSLEQAWTFFSNPANLARLTPPQMNFKVLGEDLPDEVYEDLIVRFRVAALPGFRVNWTSVISKVVPMVYFADVQVEGPFKYWHHQHSFRETDTGVEITDELHYLPPFGIIGKLFHPLIVKRKLSETFEYRYQKINEVFENA
ncbi:MAG: SRPBCC family protein [Owenweeksia sp.]